MFNNKIIRADKFGEIVFQFENKNAKQNQNIVINKQLTPFK